MVGCETEERGLALSISLDSMASKISTCLGTREKHMTRTPRVIELVEQLYASLLYLECQIHHPNFAMARTITAFRPSLSSLPASSTSCVLFLLLLDAEADLAEWDEAEEFPGCAKVSDLRQDWDTIVARERDRFVKVFTRPKEGLDRLKEEIDNLGGEVDKRSKSHLARTVRISTVEQVGDPE